MAMIAMTTSNSIKVKPSRRRGAAGRIIFSFFTGLPEKIWHPGTNSAIGHLFYLEQRARRKLPQVEQNPADLCARTPSLSPCRGISRRLRFATGHEASHKP